jgi:hypothetical protein
MLRIVIGMFGLILFYVSLPLSLASDDRIIRQRNTIDELAARVGELKAENERLSEALKNAMEASRNGREIKAGCDVAQLEEVTAFQSNGVVAEREALEWLKTEGRKCSASQLSQVDKLVRNLQFPSNPLRALTLLKNRL